MCSQALSAPLRLACSPTVLCLISKDRGRGGGRGHTRQRGRAALAGARLALRQGARPVLLAAIGLQVKHDPPSSSLHKSIRSLPSGESSPGGGDRGSIKRAELVLVEENPLVEPRPVAPELRGGVRAAGVSRRCHLRLDWIQMACLDVCRDIAVCAIDDGHLIGRLLEHCVKSLPHAVM